MKTKEIQKLIKQAKERDPDAFVSLMQIYMKDLYRTAAAILMNDADSADAIQDTILSCWEKIGTLREIRYFKTWVTKILINKCCDIKKQRGNIISIEEWEEPAVIDSCNVELYEALSALDDKYRVPMILFYGQGYRTAEIAEMLNIPKSTVQTRLARGRERLAAYYESGKE